MNKIVYHRIVYPIRKFYDLTINNFPTFNGIFVKLNIMKFLFDMGATLNQNVTTPMKIRKLLFTVSSSLQQALEPQLTIKKLVMSITLSYAQILSLALTVKKFVIESSASLLQGVSSTVTVKKFILNGDDISIDFFRLLGYWDVLANVTSGSSVTDMDVLTMENIHRGV